MHLLIRTDCDTQIFVDPCRLTKMPHINIVFLQCFKQFHTGNIRMHGKNKVAFGITNTNRVRSCSLVHSLVFMISLSSAQICPSRIDAVPNAMVIRSIVYELKEYFTSFKYLISVGLLMAKQSSTPPENVTWKMSVPQLHYRIYQSEAGTLSSKVNICLIHDHNHIRICLNDLLDGRYRKKFPGRRIRIWEYDSTIFTFIV